MLSPKRASEYLIKYRKFFFNSDSIFYFLLLLSLILLLFSEPFLKFPYDMWLHLIRIDEIYSIDKLPLSRILWYQTWANFFHWLSIENFFVRAKIIYVTQTIICVWAIFIFSRIVIRIFFHSIQKTLLNYLAYWAVIVWITVYATFSMYTHQIWIMWYSISYQVSLAFFWYITGLTLVIFFEKKGWLLKFFYITQILFFIYVILSIHPMELLYFVMYILLLLFIFIDKIFSLMKQKFFAVLFFVPLLSIVIYYSINLYHFNDSKPLILKLHLESFDGIIEAILSNGLLVINGMNRAVYSVNELMYVVILIWFFVLIHIIRNFVFHKISHINFRMFLFLSLSALFVLIPLFQIPSGLAAIISKPTVVNRFYYSSSLFVLVPIAVYFLLRYYLNNVTVKHVNISLAGILLLTFLFSYLISDTNNYYKNVKSLFNSFDERKVGFVLSQGDIESIDGQLEQYENGLKNIDKTAVYFARPDITFILKYIYHREVYLDLRWNGRRSIGTIEKFVSSFSKKRKVLKTKTPIVFKTPKSFPVYVPYK